MTVPFSVGKYRAHIYSIIRGTTEKKIYLEFVVVKRTAKQAVFLIDGKEYRRKIHDYDEWGYSYTHAIVPDPYQRNFDGDVIGRNDVYDKDRDIEWGERLERID